VATSAPSHGWSAAADMPVFLLGQAARVPGAQPAFTSPVQAAAQLVDSSTAGKVETRC